MTSVAVTILLQASLLAASPEKPSQYDQAYKESVSSGRPLMILVGADWCPACREMQTSVIPVLHRRGILRRVAFVHLNPDHDNAVTGKVMRGASIPQLIVYTRTGNGWKREQLTGVQSVESVTSLIDRAVERGQDGQIHTASSTSNATPAGEAE